MFLFTTASRPALGPTHPAMGTRSVKLTTHLLLVPRSRMRGAIPPFPHTPSCRGAQLKHRRFTAHNVSLVSGGFMLRKFHHRYVQELPERHNHRNAYSISKEKGRFMRGSLLCVLGSESVYFRRKSFRHGNNLHIWTLQHGTKRQRIHVNLMDWTYKKTHLHDEK
jgi:hypothetical protein